MRNVNENKRRGAVKLAESLMGKERAEFLMYEGWADLYILLQKQGWAWRERELKWVISTRPAVPSKPSKPVKRYDYARITLTGAVADVDVYADYWREVVSVDGWEVWQVESADGMVGGPESTRITVFIRKGK